MKNVLRFLFFYIAASVLVALKSKFGIAAVFILFSVLYKYGSLFPELSNLYAVLACFGLSLLCNQVFNAIHISSSVITYMNGDEKDGSHTA